jgi:MtN3 and saliva related transmembrane protein
MSLVAPAMQEDKRSDLFFSVHFDWQQIKQIEIRRRKYFFMNWLKICKIRKMNCTQIIGIAAGICTACSLLPQVFKTLREKKADDVSLYMLLVLQAGLILWIVYGFKREDVPIIATNCFSLLVNIIMVILRIKYKR